MAWDSKATRHRGSSSVSGASRGSLPLHTKQPKPTAIQPNSAHVADPFLEGFLDPASFDPVAYLNSVLPPLQSSSSSARSSPAGRGSSSLQPTSLAELSAQAQAQVSQLNAHTTRLASTLTQLTDEILRSGSRLAYEVELLRGETLGLAETLAEGLQDDIARFVPEGIATQQQQQQQQQQTRPKSSGGGTTAAQAPQSGVGTSEPPTPTAATATTAIDDSATRDDKTAAAAEPDAGPRPPPDPPYIARLRTLTLVRERLDSVIKTFGEAMEFVFPPSEVSVSSSFLSVSAPDPGKEAHSTEEKGQQVLKKLRDEISSLLAATSDMQKRNGGGEGAAPDPTKGIEDAARRIEELKELNKVWRGTAEEKGRAKFIESLAKLVEDRHRDLLRDLESAKRDGATTGSATDSSAAGASKRSQAAGGDPPPAESRGYGGGYGFISQLQKIRSGL